MEKIDSDYIIKINTIIDNSNDIKYQYTSLQHLIETLKSVVLIDNDNTLLSIYNKILRDMKTENIKTIKDYILENLYKNKEKIDKLKNINENINILIKLIMINNRKRC